MACGSVAFIEESNLEVRNWFDAERELVLYHDENFESRIDYILQHPEVAESIAARGLDRVQAYAGERRFTELIDRAAALPSGGRPFRSLSVDERLYQDFLMYGFSQWPVYRRLESEMLPRLVKRLPDDPRVWTALGQHLANPYAAAENEEQRQRRYVKAFVQAQRLAPGSAPYALNAATAFRSLGKESQEADFLNLTLLATGMEGASRVVGAVASPFFIRWHRAVAERTASLAMLHAEARIRFATILARRGEPSLAEEHLRMASELDPANMGGQLLLAEIQWARRECTQAADTLRRSLPDMAMELEPRNRLCEMLVQIGNKHEARILAEETLRILKACPLGCAPVAWASPPKESE
jgi:tetratricopeptide (TPR) repeat protein